MIPVKDLGKQTVRSADVLAREHGGFRIRCQMRNGKSSDCCSNDSKARRQEGQAGMPYPTTDDKRDGRA